MTEPIHKGKDLPPVWVIHAASGGDSEAKGDRHMELFVLEWALLQTICGQSVQELLGSAAVLAKYVPSPEKQPGAK